MNPQIRHPSFEGEVKYGGESLLSETQRLLSVFNAELCGLPAKDPRMYMAYFGAKGMWYYFYRNGNTFPGSVALVCPREVGIVMGCMMAAWLTIRDHGTVYCGPYSDYFKGLRESGPSSLAKTGVSCAVVYAFPSTASMSAYDLRGARWHCPNRAFITPSAPSTWKLIGKDEVVAEEYELGKMDEEIDLFQTIAKYTKRG
jgi:hypothetical protein